MARIVPDIDYKDAGLTEADLNMIGCEFLLQTEEENNITAALDDMMAPVREQNEQEKAQRLAERQAEQAAKVQHMKDVKQIVKDNAMRQVQDNEAYIMLSFDNFDNKAAFCERFGYGPYDKFIKGEVFDDQVEAVFE